MMGAIPPNAIAQQSPDETTTNLPFDMEGGKVLYIAINADPSITAEKINVVKQAIMSKSSFVKDGKTFYEGWQGALIEASKNHTRVAMPLQLRFLNSNSHMANVTIILLPTDSNTGYSGLTTFVTDHEMIKSSRMILYDTNKMSDKELSALTRHEFGHVLGLAHSIQIDNLMYPKINPQFAFISECNIHALVSLYNGDIMKDHFDNKM